MDKLPKSEANYVPLTPLTFLKRASQFYSHRKSIIYGNGNGSLTFTWHQTYERCRRLAAALRSLNLIKNDVVSVLAPNVPAMYEMHFAVPMAGGVLNAINTRLDAKNTATILKHSEAKIFFVDYQYVPLARDALRLLMADAGQNRSMPLVVVIEDVGSPTRAGVGELEYEQLVSKGDPGGVPGDINDEWDPIALNYTSGTTSEPKGVVCSHRGAFLSTLSLISGWEMKAECVYLWSLPMFHCNGWTFTWGVAARGGTNVCIRSTTAKEMYESIHRHRVTHMCCAPIVLNILLDAEPHERRHISEKVEILTGGAPPAASLLERIEGLGFHVMHAYGLTEATGPALVCEWRKEWDELPGEERARLKARQGISVLSLADVDVKDAETMQSVTRDGKMIGEIMLRGSSVMKGYLIDEAATSKAFKNGWFTTGDVGVVHPDGYLEIKDRRKDVIISGGENISSVEVEAAICKHPAVLEVAVVAMPHPRWGESPCAFVTIRKSIISGFSAADVSEADIIQHCRENLPHYTVPKKVHFLDELPKTSTGKVQKFQLRALAKSLSISTNAGKKTMNSVSSSHSRDQTVISYTDQDQHVRAVSRL